MKTMKHSQTVKPMPHWFIDHHLTRTGANELTFEPIRYVSLNMQSLDVALLTIP
jgi:hypothetical protein